MKTRTLLRTREVAERTGISENTLRYWRHTGTGPRSARLGRVVVYDADELNRWIDEQFANADSKSA